MTTLLLVEDDSSLGATLKERLEKEGFSVIWAQTNQDGQIAVKENTIHLAIIDVGLPDGDGFSLAHFIKEKQQIPFIFLTAMNSPEYRLEGYEIGAQEYIPKPFHLKELILRLKHVLANCSIEKYIDCGDFTLLLDSMIIQFADGSQEHLSSGDFSLLKALVDSSPKVLSRQEIIETIWQKSTEANARTIDNAVLRLRGLLRKTNRSCIRTVRGVGYQWLEEERNPT